jgi:tetratricopeptide (TPR) repeat protein
MTWHTDLENALKRGDKTLAFETLQKAVRGEPKNHIAHYNLGILAHQLGKKSKALEALRESVRLKPDFVEGHCAVAHRLLEQSKHTAAEASLRQALKFDPQHPTAQGALGKLKYDAGLYEEALTHLHAAAAREPDQPVHSLNIGLCQKALGRDRAAVQAFEQAFFLKPLGRDILREFSQSLKQAEDTVDDFYARLKARGDGQEPHFFGAGILFWLNGRHEESLTAFHDAAAMRPLTYRKNAGNASAAISSNYSAENPSPRYHELVAQYKIMHAQAVGEKSENIFEGVQSFLIMAPYLREFFKNHDISTLLDYGGGRGAQYELGAITAGSQTFSGMHEYLGITRSSCFDPGPGDTLSRDAQFDAVISIDVLEHCDQQDLPWIVEDLFRLARKAVFANIGAYPATKILPNGENAHCTIHESAWWQNLFAATAAKFPHIDYRFIVSYDPHQRRRETFTR